jgi:quercetin dioxygenase-like cupin family protein
MLVEAAAADSEQPAAAVWRNGMERTAPSAPSLSPSRDTLAAQEATVRSLMSKDLAGDPGRELSMITVEYPPGSMDPVHTHHAQALVYVLEGTIVMQVRGGTPVTLAAGQTFYEGPDDVHIVGRNASQTAPARFLVFLVKDKGAPIVRLVE